MHLVNVNVALDGQLVDCTDLVFKRREIEHVNLVDDDFVSRLLEDDDHFKVLRLAERILAELFFEPAILVDERARTIEFALEKVGF